MNARSSAFRPLSGSNTPVVEATVRLPQATTSGTPPAGDALRPKVHPQALTGALFPRPPSPTTLSRTGLGGGFYWMADAAQAP